MAGSRDRQAIQSADRYLILSHDHRDRSAGGQSLIQMKASITLKEYKNWSSYAGRRELDIEGGYARVALQRRENRTNMNQGRTPIHSRASTRTGPAWHTVPQTTKDEPDV